MNIGKPQRTIEIEPVTVPVPERLPVDEPVPSETPVEDPVPAEPPVEEPAREAGA